MRFCILAETQGTASKNKQVSVKAESKLIKILNYLIAKILVLAKNSCLFHIRIKCLYTLSIFFTNFSYTNNVLITVICSYIILIAFLWFT